VRISEYADPDSYHWKNQAENYQLMLAEKMGDEEFAEWADRLFPRDSIEEATWKEIAELYEAKFRVIQAEERGAEKHDWENDPKHFKTNGVY
jgi:hypothetical protein